MDVGRELRVTIIGGIHHNTLGVVRSLGEQGIQKDSIRVLIVDENAPRNNIISASKYISFKRVFYVQDNEGILDWLKKTGNPENKEVIICCSDGSAEVVMSNYAVLQKWYLPPNTSTNVEAFMSKQTQSNMAIECGFNIPSSAIVNSKEVCSWNTFPCITKPLRSVCGAGKGDIKISNSYSELRENLNKTSAEYVQIQTYIKKVWNIS